MAEIILFEQTENTNPNMSQRVAFGRAGVATENMTWTNFITWITGKLAFLKTSNNLSDLPNKTTSRTNLGVYSTSATDSLLASKAAIHPATGGALKTNNTTAFTPTADYHPATKKYVDDRANDILYTGSYNVGDVIGDADTRTLTFPSVGTSEYMVVGSMYDLLGGTGSAQVIQWATKAHSMASFQLVMLDRVGGVQNARFHYRLYPL